MRALDQEVVVDRVAREVGEAVDDHDVVAIGDLYRFDRFAAPGAVWAELIDRYPVLLDDG